MQLTCFAYLPAPITALKAMARCVGVVCMAWFGLFSSPARAECWSNWYGYYYPTSIPAQNISAAMDSLPPGTMLSSTATATSGTGGGITPHDLTPECIDGAGRRFVYEVKRTPLPGITYQANGSSYFVFDSGVQGIGYAMEVRAGTVQGTAKWVPVNTMSIPLVTTASNSATFYYEMRIIVVATGRLKSGSYSVPQQNVSGRFAIYGTGSGRLQTSEFLPWRLSSITVAARTCKLTSGAINDVVLPRVVTTSFPDSIGAVSGGAAASFSMQLNCDRDVQVYATMTDATNPANTGSALSTTSQSTAGGVGIQISRPNEATPVSFGPDSSDKGNVNQWYVGTSPATGGGVTLPLIAKYVRTGTKVTAGTVQARSTITFSYQ